MSYTLTDEELNIICNALGVDADAIVDVETLKAGMTNRSFRFRCGDLRYIMRTPGEGTENLINRTEEAAIYDVIQGLHLSDDVIYIDPHTGYKITVYLENARTCDPLSESDLELCMRRLRSFHEMELCVDHEFNIYDKIEFYESLRDGAPSCYADYARVKEHVWSLRPYIDGHVDHKVLSHIDAVPDNFLISELGGADRCPAH